MNEIDALFAKAIDPITVRPDPSDARYTNPRTWGVYEVEATKPGAAGKRFRKGNHSIRQQELQREFGEVRVVALFEEEKLATDLALHMNS